MTYIETNRPVRGGFYYSRFWNIEIVQTDSRKTEMVQFETT